MRHRLVTPLIEAADRHATRIAEDTSEEHGESG